MRYSYIGITPKFEMTVPPDAQCVEAWVSDGELIVCGHPNENENHDCDQMGCATFSHVLHRFSLAPALPRTEIFHPNDRATDGTPASPKGEPK